MSGAPDLRHGQRPYMSKASTWSVDGFLRIAYDAVAETLPDQYTTFNKVYKERWSDILRFRARSLFTSCEVCCAFKAQLQDRSLTFEQKLGCLQGYRSHLHDQYCDRTVIWTLQSEGSDPRSSILLICTDGLDQAKFSLPRDPQLRSNAGLAKHQRPRLKIHDLPEALANMVNSGSFRGIANPHDVVSLIKKHICDPTLSQPPLLVLSHH
ncbi:unnamed protein product, partial [Cladocopium goreaui]